MKSDTVSDFERSIFMKKVFALILVIVFLLTAAMADTLDLSSLSYEQLRDLQRLISAEIVKRPEWKEVTVPGGEWVVGYDIPAGNYSISLYPGASYTNVFVWGEKKGDYSLGGGLLLNSRVKVDDPKIGKVVLYTGNVVELSGPVIFAPAVSLGF